MSLLVAKYRECAEMRKTVSLLRTQYRDYTTVKKVRGMVSLLAAQCRDCATMKEELVQVVNCAQQGMEIEIPRGYCWAKSSHGRSRRGESELLDDVSKLHMQLQVAELTVIFKFSLEPEAKSVHIIRQ